MPKCYRILDSAALVIQTSEIETTDVYLHAPLQHFHLIIAIVRFTLKKCLFKESAASETNSRLSAAGGRLGHRSLHAPFFLSLRQGMKKEMLVKERQ